MTKKTIIIFAVMVAMAGCRYAPEGGDLVAEQAMGALCLNKSFLLPPRFCLLETANDPGEVLRLPGAGECRTALRKGRHFALCG